MNTPQARISIVMPVHNTARFVIEAMRSVLDQDIQELELILIDDGSSDDSVARIRSIADPRVKLLSNPAAGGPSRARNQGIRAATAPLIAFLDSDDVMEPGSLRSAIGAFELAPTAALAFGDLRRIDLEGQLLAASVLDGYPELKKLPMRALAASWNLIDRAIFARGLLYENFIGTGSVVVRSASLARVGLFDESLFNSEDRDLWFRLSRDGEALFSSAIRYSYRLNPLSISNSGGDRNARNRIVVLRRERPHWKDRAALRQIDRLIAENHAIVGFALRARGQRLRSAASFLSAFRAAPAASALRSCLGSLLGRRD